MLAQRLPLSEIERERRLADRIQARTCANVLGLAGRRHRGLAERVAAEEMPPGYAFVAQPEDLADALRGRAPWARLALAFLLQSWVAPADELARDEREWLRAHLALTPAARDAAVDDLIALAGALDGLLQVQAKRDAAYFLAHASPYQRAVEVERAFLAAYRWQHLASGVQGARFGALLGAMLTPAQAARLSLALRPILAGSA